MGPFPQYREPCTKCDEMKMNQLSALNVSTNSFLFLAPHFPCRFCLLADVSVYIFLLSRAQSVALGLERGIMMNGKHFLQVVAVHSQVSPVSRIESD